MRTSEPELSILIATQGRRNDQFRGIVRELSEQAVEKPVEIVAYWNNGELPIGEIRQALLQEARGRYVCFVDDDDKVPSYYVDEILANMGADYIGFRVKLFNDGREMPPVYHSIKYGVWHNDGAGYYRGVTHLNPLKRELALKGSFGSKGIGEDESWSRTVTPFVRSEKFIDKDMYYYYHDRNETSFGGHIKLQKHYVRPEISYGNFKWHPDSKDRNEA